jgi:hypothetical protein
MIPYADIFDKAIAKVELVPLGSASLAMSLLRSGAIDIALIGRDAYARELTSAIGRRRLLGGYTLVFTRKAAIPKEQLAEIPIKTYLDPAVVEKLIPTLNNVSFYESFAECEQAEPETPMLIDWKDFKDDHEMLIPLEANGAKVAAFRAPVIFYNTAKIGEDVTDRFEAAL